MGNKRLRESTGRGVEEIVGGGVVSGGRETELTEGVEAGQERKMTRRDMIVVGAAGVLALAGVGYGVYGRMNNSNRDKKLKQEFFRYVPVTLDELLKDPEKYQAETLGKSLGAVSPFTGEEIAGIELEFVPSEFIYESPDPDEEGTLYRWVLPRDTLNPWEKIFLRPKGEKITTDIRFNSYGKSKGLFGRVGELIEPFKNKRKIKIKGLERTQYFDGKINSMEIIAQILEIDLRRGESEKYKAMFAGFERAVIGNGKAIFYLSDDPYWDELKNNPGKNYEKIH